MDSSESPTYGEQEGSAYNGHFGCTCYHPLFVFNQLGDVERGALRSGNVHSADGWRADSEYDLFEGRRICASCVSVGRRRRDYLQHARFTQLGSCVSNGMAGWSTVLT